MAMGGYRGFSSIILAAIIIFFHAGKVCDSSRFTVTSLYVSDGESRHVALVPFAEIAALAVARGVLKPLIATIDERINGKFAYTFHVLSFLSRFLCFVHNRMTNCSP